MTKFIEQLKASGPGRAIFLAGILILATAVHGTSADMYVSNGILTVSPDSAAPGESKEVTIELNTSATPPPPNETPYNVWIGDLAADSFSRNSGTVTATFSFLASTSCGSLDVDVVLENPKTPEEYFHYLKERGFTVSTGTALSKIYVDADNASGNYDGESWSTAFQTVQEGVDAALCRGATEVWVAEGTYYPTSGTDRTVSIELASGVAVYGGFDGTETTRGQRDYINNVTILSGNIGSQDVEDNSYHVLIGADNSTIDGFTITGGYADGHPDVDSDDTLRFHRLGGGMYNDGDGGAISLTVKNCTFDDNYAESGGGMYNIYAIPTITDCTFSNNTANYGGGMLCRVYSDAVVTGTTFSGNHAEWRGGGVFVDYGANTAFTSCAFTGNTTNGNGGGFYVDDRASQIGGTFPTIASCTFTSNTATYRGGAIGAYNESTELTVTGTTTFTGNEAPFGGAAISGDYAVTLDISDTSIVFNSGQDVALSSDCACAGTQCP